MTTDDLYLTQRQADFLGALYRAVRRYKADRMWKVDAAGLETYGLLLFPEIPGLEAADIDRFVRSPDATELLGKAPLANLKSTLTAAITYSADFHTLGSFLAYSKVINY
ncbi:hypothetical protein DYL61_16295 [Pseudomonas nabeulensis]|uniref:Uncharacterized protein n=1 Tax=Pseudomonas nabeulensis TaxID=2293833 RepID=A0A4Z0B1N1_9PSED|nr:hypothetical protein [Pseudomonas nabeulensis]TFY92956.1 hypothetical protein DYL61_16295 [Pseudomonas nabeulensis]